MLRILPDAELTVIEFIAGHPGLASYLAGGRVGSFLTQERPYVQVNRIGGRPSWEEDNPQLQIAVWHTSDSAASQLARAIVAAMPDILSDTVRGQAVLLGPFSQPDEDNQRYLITIELLTYPEA